MHYRRWRRTGETGPARQELADADYYVDAETRRIPCRDRFGMVRAWALVDVGDFDRLMERRWHYGARYVRSGVGPSRNNRTLLRLQNEVFGLPPGSGMEVDHIDRDPLNNRRANLRILQKGLNQQNASKAKGKSSRFRGVSLSNGYWVAGVTSNGVFHYGGRFKDEEEAGRAAAALRRQYLPLATD